MIRMEAMNASHSPIPGAAIVSNWAIMPLPRTCGHEGIDGAAERGRFVQVLAEITQPELHIGQKDERHQNRRQHQQGHPLGVHKDGRQMSRASAPMAKMLIDRSNWAASSNGRMPM